MGPASEEGGEEMHLRLFRGKPGGKSFASRGRLKEGKKLGLNLLGNSNSLREATANHKEGRKSVNMRE